MRAHNNNSKTTSGWTEGSGLPPEDELQYVIRALNGEMLFAVTGPENDKEWHLLDKLERETREPLRYYVDLWERSGRNLKKMWRDYYVESLRLYKYSETHPIQLGLGDSNRVSYHHTFLDRYGSTPDEEAALFFLTLICNSQNEKLGGPCAGCDRYFMRRTAGNTTYCSRSCASRATAIAATNRKRAQEHAYKLHRARAAHGAVGSRTAKRSN